MTNGWQVNVRLNLGRREFSDPIQVALVDGPNGSDPPMILFGDVDGSGTDDIILPNARDGQTNGPIFVAFEAYSPNSTPRPGAITSMTNGYGLTAHVQYERLADLERKADLDESNPLPTYSPVAAYLATRVDVTRRSPQGTAGWPYEDPSIAIDTATYRVPRTS